MAAPAAKSMNDASTLGPMLAALGLPPGTFTRRMSALSRARRSAREHGRRVCCTRIGKKRKARQHGATGLANDRPKVPPARNGNRCRANLFAALAARAVAACADSRRRRGRRVLRKELVLQASEQAEQRRQRSRGPARAGPMALHILCVACAFLLHVDSSSRPTCY